jgi:hypothetical protein
MPPVPVRVLNGMEWIPARAKPLAARYQTRHIPTGFGPRCPPPTCQHATPSSGTLARRQLPPTSGLECTVGHGLLKLTLWKGSGKCQPRGIVKSPNYVVSDRQSGREEGCDQPAWHVPFPAGFSHAQSRLVLRLPGLAYVHRSK